MSVAGALDLGGLEVPGHPPAGDGLGGIGRRHPGQAQGGLDPQEDAAAHHQTGHCLLPCRPLDPSTINSPNLPNIEIPSTIEVSGMELWKTLRGSKLMGDLVNFSIDANSFNVHVQGQPDSANRTFSKDELESLNCSAPARSQYSLTYLVPIAKLFSSVDSVKMGFGESFPLRIEFTFMDGAGEVTYFLAPRVESDY